MLFIVEEPKNPPSTYAAFAGPVEEVSLYQEIFGHGGPEKESRAEEFLETFFDSKQEYGISSEPEQTITTTYNHMKVANTVLPVDTPDVSSDYGWRTPPCKGCSADHKGIDFVPGYGTPIYAVTDGMIVDMGRGDGYGYYAIVEHLVGNTDGEVDEWTTIYAHMKKDSFAEGLRIGSVLKTGDVIGAVGSTGLSTGPHLHFELIINGKNVDPMPLLGTYEVVVVEEEDHEDWLYLGDTFRVVTMEKTYR